MTKLVLDKLSVARRQLSQCIHLFFEGGDAVSLHTLAVASHQILYDLAKQKGEYGMLRRNSYFRPEQLKSWNERLNAPHTFFKHADRDPTNTITFETELSQAFIFDALMLIQALGFKLSITEFTFGSWFAVKNPDLVLESDLTRDLSSALGKLDVNDLSAFARILKANETMAERFRQ